MLAYTVLNRLRCFFRLEITQLKELGKTTLLPRCQGCCLTCQVSFALVSFYTFLYVLWVMKQVDQSCIASFRLDCLRLDMSWYGRAKQYSWSLIAVIARLAYDSETKEGVTTIYHTYKTLLNLTMTYRVWRLPSVWAIAVNSTVYWECLKRWSPWQTACCILDGPKVAFHGD